MHSIFTHRMKCLTAIWCLWCLHGCESRLHQEPVSAQIESASLPASATSSIDGQKQKPGDAGSQDRKTVKPGAAVSLKNTQPLFVSTPGVLDFQLALISPVADGKMSVDIAASDGLSIVSRERHFDFELNETGEYLIPISVSAETEGRFYIHLHTSITVDDHSSSRSLAAILQVGARAEKSQKPHSKSSDQSEPIRVLPAQETISPD